MNYLYDLWDDFISLLFPRVCYGCGNHLLRNENLICTGCYVTIPRTNYHLQPENPVAQLFWGRCLVEKAAAFSYYERGSRIRNLIHRLKYSGIKEIGYELGRIYGVSLKSSGFTSLVRVVLSETQTTRSRYDRWTNVEGIFRVDDSDSIRGKHILLVDDVITTGSTIESCVNELLKVADVKVSVVAIGYAVV